MANLHGVIAGRPSKAIVVWAVLVAVTSPRVAPGPITSTSTVRKTHGFLLQCYGAGEGAPA